MEYFLASAALNCQSTPKKSSYYKSNITGDSAGYLVDGMHLFRPNPIPFVPISVYYAPNVAIS